EEEGHEDRHERERRRLRKQRAAVELEPAGDEEEGDEDPEARLGELLAEVRVRHRLVAVDELEDGAGHEGAENRLEPELLREHDEADEEDEGAADADLRRGVLQAEKRAREPHRALRAEDGEAD